MKTIQEIRNEADERFIGWAKFGLHFCKASFIEGARWVNDQNRNIEPLKPVEWKTFLIETMSQKTNVPYRFIAQYWSLDAAKEDNQNAISIVEVKFSFEEVVNK